MKINFLILSLVSILLLGCSQIMQPKTTTQASKTKTFSNSYEVSSPHGHRFKIEVDYIARDLNTLSNDCKAQYIVTNIGTKDYIREEQFQTGKKNSYGGIILDFDPSLIFEFTTSDGKKIEASETMMDNIFIGRSTEAKSVHINAGIRICVGEVKPVRIQYRTTN